MDSLRGFAMTSKTTREELKNYEGFVATDRSLRGACLVTIGGFKESLWSLRGASNVIFSKFID